ncbi:MAG TPA: tRNA (adenosine(37)-N6)-dimethylallyltransferase MiaA [Candidatus Kapabacteria bacterium]|nr:tRNA (adenosine(37)-N6)-dimethylallyltransferase MiaA [Candidatus Kapabacteria bacterium]
MNIDVITGPTASGKSALALERARSDRTIEIVNADASLLYIGFDIGTAKPSRTEREEIPHHIIDILPPSQQFSAADYSSLARKIIREIISRNKTPLIVGGTAFYIDALFNGLSITDADQADLDNARNRYENELAKNGFENMLSMLQSVDKILFEQITRERNPRRLLRAWEFYYATGSPLGQARQHPPEPFEYLPTFTVLLPERSILNEKIVHRIDEMLSNGWLAEVEKLLRDGVTEEMQAMKAIGYRTLVEVLRGKKELLVARDEIIVQTRQYAKRQTTWMKRYVKL